jgi:hypothetical protein
MCEDNIKIGLKEMDWEVVEWSDVLLWKW